MRKLSELTDAELNSLYTEVQKRKIDIIDNHIIWDALFDLKTELREEIQKRAAKELKVIKAEYKIL